MDKTADQIAEDAAAAVTAEENPDGGDQSKVEPAPAQADFSDDDLDPEKIEAGLTAKTLSLDNAGLLKRFKKVHGSLKEMKAWKAEREPKLSNYEKQAQAVDKMLQGLNKLRSKDEPQKQSFLEDLIETLMDEKGTPNWKAAKEAIEKILAASEGDQNVQRSANGSETPAERQMRERLDALEKERDASKAAQVQNELNGKVTEAYRAIPKELDKIEEFKGLPWKDAEWKKEFVGQIDDKVLAWSVTNQEQVSRGVFPPILDFAKAVAKLYLRGGSDILKRQVEGGKPKGLNRGNGPSGGQTRKLPTPGDREAEMQYLNDLATSLE